MQRQRVEDGKAMIFGTSQDISRGLRTFAASHYLTLFPDSQSPPTVSGSFNPRGAAPRRKVNTRFIIPPPTHTHTHTLLPL